MAYTGLLNDENKNQIKTVFVEKNTEQLTMTIIHC